MKKQVVLTVIAILLPIIVACSSNSTLFSAKSQTATTAAPAAQSESPAAVSEEQDAARPQTTASLGYGSSGALADDSYSMEEMLTYAIQDEYAARDEYAAITGVLGDVNPFTNIVKAEELHISQLITLFESSNINVPEDTYTAASAPATLDEAKSIGAQAEINNIAMYDRFLQADLPADVQAVFQSLKTASEGHLTAFQSTDTGIEAESGNGKGDGTGSGKNK